MSGSTHAGEGWQKYLPIMQWGAQYSRQLAFSDLTAAVIVTLMLVPQALAYAMLSGLPPEVGLYASMLPLLAYALLGTSTTLAVGPVAVAALMTASAIAPFSAQDPTLGLQAAVILACISGLFLLLSGLLKLGFLANFLSHPVIAGFIAATSILIATSQLPTLLGINAHGDNLPSLWQGIAAQINHWHPATSLLSAGTLALLVLTRLYGTRYLHQLGSNPFWAQTISRAVPAMLVIGGTLAMHTHLPGWNGIQTVGHIPAGLPNFALPAISPSLWQALLMPAIMISIVGYVESISVAQNLAMKRRERIRPNQELIALGVANLAASISAGQPVTGGVSRSVVNMDAGAQTPAAGLMTAIGMLLATVFLAGWLSELPRLILAATIVVAVLSLFDLSVFFHTWQRNRSDFVALFITFAITLFINVETGISAGVMLSIGLHLYRSSRPHMAIVGQVPGTEHFRNVERHQVALCPDVVTLRIDESLYFANARYLEQKVLEIVAETPGVKHLVLMCSAVNAIDSSALEVLEMMNAHLQSLGIGFHLSEVKGPVMDILHRSHLPEKLNGQIYLTQFKAYEALACLHPT